jgi:hypothetical protein
MPTKKKRMLVCSFRGCNKKAMFAQNFKRHFNRLDGEYTTGAREAYMAKESDYRTPPSSPKEPSQPQMPSKPKVYQTPLAMERIPQPAAPRKPKRTQSELYKLVCTFDSIIT